MNKRSNKMSQSIASGSNRTKSRRSGKLRKPLKGGLAHYDSGTNNAIARFTSRIMKVNSRFSWPADDYTCIHVRSTRSHASTTSSTTGTCFILDPTLISAGGYVSLGAYSPLVVAMSTSYSRYMVTDVTFKVTLTTPITNGGFLAVGFEPDNSNVSGPPTTVADATTSVHSDLAQVGASAVVHLDPSQYFIDWRPTLTSGGTVPDNQCGVFQVYADSGSTGSVTYLLEVDAKVHFVGFRRLGA